MGLDPDHLTHTVLVWLGIAQRLDELVPVDLNEDERAQVQGALTE